MTVDDLEWPKRTHVEKSFYRVHQKNLNEDRHILSVAKCTSMIIVYSGYSLGSLVDGFSEVPKCMTLNEPE